MNSTHRARAVTSAEWEVARHRLPAKEQDLTCARDALAADRRRMPCPRVEQVAHLTHLNARNTTLAFASHAPQPDIERATTRMGRAIPRYTITDGFDADFGVAEWYSTNAFIRDGDSVYRTYFINDREHEPMGGTVNSLDFTALGRQEDREDSPAGCPQVPRFSWLNRHDGYGPTAPASRLGTADPGRG